MRPQPSMSASIELPARAASGLVMVAATIFAVVVGGRVFGGLVAIGAVAALREWHRLVNRGALAWQTIATAVAVAIAVFAAEAPGGVRFGLIAVATGAVAAALWSSGRRSAPVWHGLGAFYVGIPALALVILRSAGSGAHLVLGLFIAVWVADTGALFGGRLIGGPKLVPKLSPNKTWAGFTAGTLAAGVAEAVYVRFSGGSLLTGFGFGMAIALFGHAGDLFESWVKRRFRAKDSGASIPGHGGVLDRIDSLLFAAPACAVLVNAFGFTPF